MNMRTLCDSVGQVLYDKGVIGHVTIDLVSFPDPTSPTSHPLFWAVDLNCQMTDYSAACYFFDFLMEGTLDQYTGKYTINNSPEEIDNRSETSSRLGSDNSSPLKATNSSRSSVGRKTYQSRPKSHTTSSTNDEWTEQRSFMYVKYLHHPGISKIQYKTFFHMCRLRNISFDLE